MPNLLTAKQVAEILGVTPNLLKNWRLEKKNLPYIKLGEHAVRYEKSEVLRFLKEQTVPTQHPVKKGAIQNDAN